MSDGPKDQNPVLRLEQISMSFPIYFKWVVDEAHLVQNRHDTQSSRASSCTYHILGTKHLEGPAAISPTNHAPEGIFEWWVQPVSIVHVFFLLTNCENKSHTAAVAQIHPPSFFAWCKLHAETKSNPLASSFQGLPCRNCQSPWFMHHGSCWGQGSMMGC